MQRRRRKRPPGDAKNDTFFNVATKEVIGTVVVGTINVVVVVMVFSVIVAVVVVVPDAHTAC